MEKLMLALLGLVIVFAIARKCKSTKMFWILLTCICIGFIGGSIAASISNKKAAATKKNVCVLVSATSTHALCANLFTILTHNGQSGYVSKTELPQNTYPVVKLYNTQTFNKLSSKLHTFNPDIDIGTVNTS